MIAGSFNRQNQKQTLRASKKNSLSFSSIKKDSEKEFKSNVNVQTSNRVTKHKERIVLTILSFSAACGEYQFTH